MLLFKPQTESEFCNLCHHSAAIYSRSVSQKFTALFIILYKITEASLQLDEDKKIMVDADG